MRLTQRQIAKQLTGYDASRIMHKARSLGCRISKAENGRDEVSLCEYYLKSKDKTVLPLMEKLRIMPDFN